MSDKSARIIFYIVWFLQFLGIFSCMNFIKFDGPYYPLEFLLVCLCFAFYSFLPVTGTIIAINCLASNLGISLLASSIVYSLPFIFSALFGLAMLANARDFIMFWVARDFMFYKTRNQVPQTLGKSLWGVIVIILAIGVFLWFASVGYTLRHAF